ncbi:S1 family peptidase [Nocardiopsis kunsanensis]|uniref:Serine protease n=1 Tax=Nocardiopsis kunsanensis TaxID=141693 RepID=A0A919CGP1_9ACTN|nr:S1 family peptidase [Nocardiopsis kunsanensis]GHD20374.1 serine protease [Nocardiopsis kunsanensis]
MRASPIISAIGTGALALGMSVAAAPTAGAAPAPQNPTEPAEATTMAEALERDLGLNEAEATDLIDAQESALDVDAEATEAAGEHYGGSLFDTETHDLTVLVTDSAAVPGVEAAGAEAAVVEHGVEGLDDLISDLDSAGAQEGVVGWYPEVENDTVVIETLEGADADVDALLSSAGVDPADVRVETTDEAPEVYANIVGGDAYTIGGSSRCSVGFPASDSYGQPGFVTAGHCGTTGSSVSIGNGSGVFSQSVFPGNDAAFVRGTSNFSLTNLVNRYNSGSDVAVSGSTQAPIGSQVCRSGSTTGWHCGTIQARGQTVSYPQGTVRDLTRTSVCAEPGDSGGSFISGSQAQGVTSGGSGNCSWGGTTYYQEVNPMLNSWNLNLST